MSSITLKIGGVTIERAPVGKFLDVLVEDTFDRSIYINNLLGNLNSAFYPIRNLRFMFDGNDWRVFYFGRLSIRLAYRILL